MIESKTFTGQNGLIYCQLSGMGLKTVPKMFDNPEALYAWKRHQYREIIFKRLVGIVIQRKKAYGFKKYTGKDQLVTDLSWYLDRVHQQPLESLCKMVVAHKAKWLRILPPKENLMHTHMGQIISFCEKFLALKPVVN
jgi:hypothetical protein